MKSVAERIIDKFGGVSAMARILKHDYPTTVQGWKTRKRIPADRQQEVLDAARANKIDLSPEDFFNRDDAA
jgi:hypothetical protein